MPIDRRLLIIGNAMLFSTLGCDDTGVDEPDMGGTPRDARMTVDRAFEPDIAEPDLAPPADMEPADDMVWLDASPDIGPQPDMAMPDMAPEDMAIDRDMILEDMSPEDMALEDMSVEDMASEDMAPPEPDMEPPPARCADTLGEVCMVDNEGCCPDGQNPEAVCWPSADGRLTWQPIPGDFFCNCWQEPGATTYQVACAVPGFVGVERAGRRLRGPRLRALIAATA